MFSPSTPVNYLLYLSSIISITSAQGQIAQFLDISCDEKSPINPTVSLPLDTCLVTEGAQGVVVQVYPACLTGNGNTTLQMYQDQSCATPGSSDDISDNQGCYWLFAGSGIPAVMFICGSVADGDSHATSTTTVTAGSVLVPVAKATGATTSLTPGSLSSQTATDSNGLITSTTAASSASNPSQTNGSGTGSGSSSGLSQHDQIILGIVLPAGALLVAVLAWQWPRPPRGGVGSQHNDYRMLPVVHHMPHWHRG